MRCRATAASLYRLEPMVDGWAYYPARRSSQLTSDEGTRPASVALEYEFAAWSGDAILWSTPHYIITADVYDRLESGGLTGLSKGPLLISVYEERRVNGPPLELPRFVWFKPTGKIRLLRRTVRPERDGELDFGWSGHDFCLGPRAELVVTQRALDAVGLERIWHATIKPLVVLRPTEACDMPT